MNPFVSDPDRSAIWEMLMTRDFEAFAACDWSVVADDFVDQGFFGVHGGFTADPDKWMPQFPKIEPYRDEWLRQAGETAAKADKDSLMEALYSAATLSQIDIAGNFAVAHKKFDGLVPTADGEEPIRKLWQTLYFCRKVAGTWKIAGFVGYIPNPMPPVR